MKEMETYKDRAGCMKKAFENLESRNMLEAGDVVAAGISGGADSVCLLLVLKAYAESHPEKQLQIKAVHVEHGIRGEESLEDARFVKALCEQWEIPLTGCPTSRSTELPEELPAYPVLPTKSGLMGKKCMRSAKNTSASGKICVPIPEP